MIPRSLLAPSLLCLTACAARGGADDLGRAARAETGEPSIFKLLEQQRYPFPDIPDDLASVDDILHPRQTVSLRDGTVTSAWTTVPNAAGDTPALVYHCESDGAEHYRWKVMPDAGLVPIGVDPTLLAATLPFTASHTYVPPEGLYQFVPTGPAWRVCGQTGRQAGVTPLCTQLIGYVDAQADGPNFDSIPLYRYHKSIGITSGFTASEMPTLDRAEYVLRLNTVGGIGPDDDGAECDKGSLDVRVEFSADFYFVTMPWSHVL